MNVDDIAARFLGVPPFYLRVQPLTSGHINDTYKIGCIAPGCNTTNFVLQRVNHQIFNNPARIMHNIAQVAAYLKACGYPRQILEPLPTRDGAFLFIEKNGEEKAYWRMFPFIENGYTVDQVKNTGQARAASFAFGEYARYLSDMDARNMYVILPNFHNADFRIRQFREALAVRNNQERFQIAAPEIEEAEKWTSFFLKPTRTPLRIVHNDTKINNLIFNAHTHEAMCIVDLDVVMPGALLSDFGDLVRTYTPEIDENSLDRNRAAIRLPYFEALAEGYLSALDGIITTKEKDLLVFGAQRVIFVQALRFLTDYLSGDVYYKTDYPEHNIDRARNQLALFISSIQLGHNMQEIIAAFKF